VIAVNTALDKAPETVNRDPYEAGWLIKIKPSNPSEAGTLLDAAAYAKLTE
jgi:glycine cleavage system H protein